LQHRVPDKVSVSPVATSESAGLRDIGLGIWKLLGLAETKREVGNVWELR